METLYRKVLCGERLPDNKKTFTTNWGEATYHPLLKQWRQGGKKWRKIEPKYWFEELQPQEQATVDEINELIQPHAITLEHGEKAAQAIHYLVYGEKPPKAEG